jgi:hypothetical protein
MRNRALARTLAPVEKAVSARQEAVKRILLFIPIGVLLSWRLEEKNRLNPCMQVIPTKAIGMQAISQAFAA